MMSFAATGIYCSTKFAVEGLSEALAKEVASLGIKVTIVEPGAFRTDFNGRTAKGGSLRDRFPFQSNKLTIMPRQRVNFSNG